MPIETLQDLHDPRWRSACNTSWTARPSPWVARAPGGAGLADRAGASTDPAPARSAGAGAGAGDHGLARPLRRLGLSQRRHLADGENFLAGGAAVSVLARQHGLALTVVDQGVRHDSRRARACWRAARARHRRQSARAGDDRGAVRAGHRQWPRGRGRPARQRGAGGDGHRQQPPPLRCCWPAWVVMGWKSAWRAPAGCGRHGRASARCWPRCCGATYATTRPLQALAASVVSRSPPWWVPWPRPPPSGA